ncbi:MAG: UDP-N-acetylglucosamine 2-epimerase (non-hydrolyzing) [Patulibacter sp.]
MTAESAVRFLVVVGTRPEAIKLAPVVRALRDDARHLVAVVDTGQQPALVPPALAAVGLASDVRLTLERHDHGLNELLGRLIAGLDRAIAEQRPDVVLVQGDTTSALAGALAAFHRGVPVGHVEAGLRSGDPRLPFPEEANRRMITALARWHFAPTARAADALRAEGVPAESVHLTGNPIVDELHRTLALTAASPASPVPRGRKLLVATLHRRESIGAPIAAVLRALRRIADADPAVDVWLPLHANPQVRDPAVALLGAHPRIRLEDAAEYPQFLRRLAAADLVITDSGGVTEEAAVLGVPTLVVREQTERREAIDAGIARLLGTDEDAIVAAATQQLADGRPAAGTGAFGSGDAGVRIAAILRAEVRPDGGTGP